MQAFKKGKRKGKVLSKVMMNEKEHSGGDKSKTKGLLRVSKKCKICQSSHLNEITAALLEGRMNYREIIEKWGKDFDPPLSGTNINSHKQHCNPRAVAKIDANRRELSLVDFDPAVIELYNQKYDEALNKIKTVNLLYDARLHNLWELLAYKKNLDDKKDRTDYDNKTLKELTTSIDEIMRGLTKDLLMHVKIETQGPPQINVNVAFVQNFKKGINEFIGDFVDVLVEEIDDPLIRERIKERFVEKLESRVSPLLDSKAVVVDAEVVDDEDEK